MTTTEPLPESADPIAGFLFCLVCGKRTKFHMSEAVRFAVYNNGHQCCGHSTLFQFTLAEEATDSDESALFIPSVPDAAATRLDLPSAADTVF